MRKTEIGALLIHKKLLDLMDGERRLGAYDEFMGKLLQIGGSYKPKSRIWVGLGLEETFDHYIVMPENPKCKITITNPLYAAKRSIYRST